MPGAWPHHAGVIDWASALLANPTPPQLNDQTIWMIVAAVGVGVLYFLMRPRKGNKRDPLGGGVPSFPLARQRGVEEQMSNLLVELSEMARQISAQLDTRAAKLELLIKEADEKIAALRGTRAGDGSAAASPAASPAPQAAEGSSTTTIAPTAHVDSAEQAALSDMKDATAPALAAAPPAADPRHAEVYAMADEGRSANEIARALHRPAGEVELILALRVR
jgi:hypothetical protein